MYEMANLNCTLTMIHIKWAEDVDDDDDDGDKMMMMVLLHFCSEHTKQTFLVSQFLAPNQTHKKIVFLFFQKETFMYSSHYYNVCTMLIWKPHTFCHLSIYTLNHVGRETTTLW